LLKDLSAEATDFRDTEKGIKCGANV